MATTHQNVSGLPELTWWGSFSVDFRRPKCFALPITQLTVLTLQSKPGDISSVPAATSAAADTAVAVTCRHVRLDAHYSWRTQRSAARHSSSKYWSEGHWRHFTIRAGAIQSSIEVISLWYTSPRMLAALHYSCWNHLIEYRGDLTVVHEPQVVCVTIGPRIWIAQKRRWRCSLWLSGCHWRTSTEL